MRAKYWLSDACKLVLLLPAGALVFILIMILQGSSDTFREYLTEFTSFYVFSGALVQIIMLQVSFKLQIPLAVSMGCTRREAHLGYHLYRLTFIVLALCIYIVLSHLPGNAICLSIFFVLGVYLLMSAAGSGMGILVLKWGSKAAIAFFVCFGLLCGVLGGLTGMEVFSVSQPLLHGPVPVLTLILGLASYLLMALPEGKQIQSMVIKL